LKKLFISFALLISTLAGAKEPLIFASYNIRNFDYDMREDIPTNKSELAKIIKGINADLIAVQEIVQGDIFEAFVKKRLPNFSVSLSTCGGAGRQKLGFVYRTSKLELLKFIEDNSVSGGGKCGRGLRPAAIGKFKIKSDSTEFTAFSLHLKAGGRPQNADVRFKQYGFITQIVESLKRDGQKNIVMMGDLNTTHYLLKDKYYARFVDFVSDNGLVDMASQIKCSSYWWGGRNDGKEYKSLLDHVMISQEFYNSFKSHSISVKSHCEKSACKTSRADELGISYQEVSDHCPVVATLK
jgi:endonuclease/exonuclease/phosphatase family metal-dependent hydrolase